MDSILVGAAKALETKGPDFTMDYLAKSIHISKRTIYEKYKSKQEIISLIFQAKIENIYEEHQRILKDETLTLEEKLVLYFTVQSKSFNTIGTERVRNILNSTPSIIADMETSIKKDWALLEAFLRQEIQKGHLKSVNAETIIFIFKSVSYGMFEKENFTFDDRDRVLTESVQMLLKGIEM